MNTILLGVVMFTGVVLALVALILVAKSKLVASGPVKILINEQKEIDKILLDFLNLNLFQR